MTKIAVGDLRNAICGDGPIERIRDTITGHGRWSVYHELVFKSGGKFYRVSYSIGATESQDEQPFEHGGDRECEEVEPYEKTVIEYRVKP